MPGKESEPGRNGSTVAVGNTNGKAAPPETDIAFEWDSSRDSPQDWNRVDRGESMRSGSGRSLASLGSKGETNSISESTASGPPTEVGKEAKEKKDKSSWVKTIGMRTLRLRKNKDKDKDKDKDPDKAQSRLSISSALGSLDRPGKSKSKKEKQGKGGGDDQKQTSLAGTSSSSTNAAFAASHKPGEHVKDNDSIYSGASSKNGSAAREVVAGSSSTNAPTSAAAGESADKQDPARFLGEGLLFKGKLIGVLEVSGPRGDRICQEALSELKMAVKAAGEHKQKITIHIALDGLRIRDEKTGDCLYHHQVHKISFIAQDLTDARAFGYIFGSPDTGHRFFGIKTEKSASQVVIAMRDLFQVVFDLKKKEIERAKQQLEMQQKFLATRAAETAPTTKTEPKFSIAETYIEGAGAVGGAMASSSNQSRPSAPAEVDLLNLEVELNSLQEGLENIHTNLVDSVPFRGSTASISSDPMNPMPMPKLSIGSVSNASNPTAGPSAGGDPFGDSFDPFDGGAVGPSPGSSGATAFSSSNHRYSFKTGLKEPSPSLSLGNSQQQQQSTPYSNTTTPLAFTSDPFAQVDPFPGPKYHGDGDFFNSDPFESPSGQFSFAYPNPDSSPKISANTERVTEESINDHPASNHKADTEREAGSGIKSLSYRDRHADGWVASFEDNFVPDSKGNLQFDDLTKAELDIFTELDPLGTGRIRPFVDRKDFFQHLKNPTKKNLKDLGAVENLTPHSSSSSLVAEGSVVNSSMVGLGMHNVSSNSVELNPLQPPKVQLQDASPIPNSFSTNFTTPQPNDITVDHLPLRTPPTSASSRSSSIRMRLHSENSRSESPPNYSPPPPPHAEHFSSTSSIGSAAGMGAATNSEYMSTTGATNQLPFLPPPSSVLGTPPSSRFSNKKSPQLLKQMTIAGSTASTATSSPKTLPRPSSSGRRERKLTADSQSSVGTDEIPNLTPPPRPPHTTNTLGKSVSLSTAVPRPSSGSDRLRNLSGMSSLSGNVPGIVPPEPPPRPLQTTTISSGFSQQMSPSLVSPPPPLPPKKQNFSSMQSSPLNLFSSSSKQTSLTDFGKSGLQKGGGSESSNDLPLPLPSRKSQLSASISHQHATAGARYSVPLSSVSPSVQRREQELEQSKSPSLGRKSALVMKLTMEQALHQVASMSLGDLAGKLELPVEKLSSLTIQQLAEKLTLMDFEQKMEQKERELSRYGSVSQIQQQQQHRPTTANSRDGAKSDFQFGFEDDFSTTSAPPDFAERSSHKSKKDEYDKYAVFRELSVEEASGFSIIASLGSNLKPMSDFSANSEDEDLSRTMDKTLTNKDSSSERTIQADGTGESRTKNNDTSFATAMANTMDDITDANLSDDDGKFPFDDDDDISPSSNFNTKPAEWATFDSHFDDQFATTSLVKAVDADGNGSPWDSEDGAEGDNSQKTPLPVVSNENEPISQRSPLQAPKAADKFDFEPFQKPSQPAVTNYSLTESQNQPSVPPVPERRRPVKENGGIPQPSGSQPLSPDLLRSPVSQFHRQSSGSSKHSGKSIEEPSIGGGRGSDYSESGGRSRHRRGSNDEDSARWERDREKDSYRRRRNSRENFGRSDSRDSYSSLTRGKYRDGRGAGGSEEEYVPSKSTSGRRAKGSSARPTSSKRSSEREGEPEDEREEEEDTRSYASYHSNYSSSAPRRHRRYPPKYHNPHYSSSHRRRERDRADRPPAQAAGSGHSSLSPERYSHHESDFDDSCEDENGVVSARKKEYYAREREYSDRHYHRPRPTSGTGYHHPSGKRYSPRSSASDPYYRDRYYRGERRRRKYDDEYEDGREFSEYSAEDERYHGRHGKRRRHRGRDDYYRERERETQRHHHYYTNSPSWDSESGPEPGATGEKSEKGHRPSSAKYGSEPGSGSRYSPPSTSSRPNSGRRESGTGGTQSHPLDPPPALSGNGHGSHHKKRPQSASASSTSGKMREYRFDDEFGGDLFGSNKKHSEPLEKLADLMMTDDKPETNVQSMKVAKCYSPAKSDTITPIDAKLSQPQSPFEDNFVIPSNGTGEREETVQGENDQSEVKDVEVDLFLPEAAANEDGEENATRTHHKKPQQQIFFPTKFESKDGTEDDGGEDVRKVSIGGDLLGGEDERENTSSPEMTYTPPTSANSLRGNFSVYSTKRLESIRSEEEKSNEDSVSESALNPASAANANATNMKKSDSFNIFQAPAQDLFADDDFFK